MPADLMPEITFRELQKKAVQEGMSAEDVKKFNTKPALVAAMSFFNKKSEGSEQPVKSLDEVPNIQEEKKIEKNYNSKAEVMRKHLESQPKVSIIIPLEATETRGVVTTEYSEKTGREEQVHVSGSIHEFFLNGYRFIAPKGVYTELPRQLADLVKVRWGQESEIAESLSINRVDPETGKPVSSQL